MPFLLSQMVHCSNFHWAVTLPNEHSHGYFFKDDKSQAGGEKNFKWSLFKAWVVNGKVTGRNSKEHMNDVKEVMRGRQEDVGTEGRLTEVLPVGQGLEGSVHVAGVADILQPRQAWGRQRTPGKLKQVNHQVLVNFDGSQKASALFRKPIPSPTINILQPEPKKCQPAVS